MNVNNGAGGCTPKVYTICNDNSNCTVDSCVESTGQCSFVDVVLPSSNNTCILASCDPEYGVTATNISCKGIDCVQDPSQVSNFLQILHEISRNFPTFFGWQKSHEFSKNILRNFRAKDWHEQARMLHMPRHTSGCHHRSRCDRRYRHRRCRSRRYHRFRRQKRLWLLFRWQRSRSWSTRESNVCGKSVWWYQPTLPMRFWREKPLIN